MKTILTATFMLFSSVCFASDYYTGTAHIAPDYGAGMPSKGGSSTDTTTGATVVRRTDIAELTPDLPADAMMVYSRFSPINTAGEYGIVHGTDSTSAWLFKLSDNSIVSKVLSSGNAEIGEVNEIRWDYTGSYPNRIYFVSGMSFYSMDVVASNGTPTLIRDFSTDYPSGVKIINDVEGDSSNDSRYWAWQVRGAYNGSYFPLLNIVVYDKQTNTIVGDLGVGDVTPTQNPGNWTTEMPRPNMVEISPDGSKVITHYGRSYTGSPTADFDGTYFNAPHAWNLDFSGAATRISNDETHSGWAWDSSGKPLFVSQQNSTDRFEACRIDTQDYPTSCTTFFNHTNVAYAGVHFAKMPVSKPGYVLASFYVNAGEWQASTAYGSFNKVRVGEYIFAASTAGTSGGTEPTWPTTQGATVNDGSVVWSNWGAAWPQNSNVMIEIDDLANNPAVWRISPGFNEYAGGYRDEASAAISLDGLSIYWTGNWGDATTGHGEVLSVDLPADWLCTLNGNCVTSTPRSRYGLGTSTFGTGFMRAAQ